MCPHGTCHLTLLTGAALRVQSKSQPRSARPLCRTLLLAPPQLDYHPHDSEPEVLREPAAFAARWRALAAALRCLPNYASDLDGRVLFDLLNEPDEYGCGDAQSCANTIHMHGKVVASM